MQQSKNPWVKHSLIGAALALASCSAWADRLVTDMAGRSVQIPDQVQRVYAVGHCIPIIGAVAPKALANNYRLQPKAKDFLSPLLYENKVMPSTGNRLSDEEVVRMAPDLVFMEHMPGAEDRADRLAARLKVPVLLVDLNVYQYPKAFQFLGEVLNQPQQAQALTDFVNQHLYPIAERAKSIPEAERKRVYYAEGPDGLFTNPAGSSHTQVLDFIGAINVAKVTQLPDEGMSAVSLEQLYLWQPEHILVWTPAADQLTTWKAIVHNPLWQSVKAVREHQVIQIPWLPFSWFDRPPGSNLILGVFWLADRLYPEVYSLKLNALVREYVRLFYHQDISEADVEYLLSLANPEQSKPN